MYTPFFVYKNRVLIKVHPEKVVLLSTEKNYTWIYLSDHSHHMVRSTLSRALKKLPPGMFLKVHRSMAVSVFYMDQINRDHLLLGDESIPIGKTYYESLIKQLNIID